MHFVLVHGAWHGAWCWDPLVAALRARGADATTLDLPGHGEDTTPVAEIDLEAYARRVEFCVQELDRPVELVGHSMGGAVISRAAELVPQRLAGLTYVAAFLARDGESLSRLGAEDPDTRLNAALRPGPEPDTLIVADEAVTEVFYHDCPAALAETARAHLVPQAVAPLRDRVVVSERMWGSVPRAYILCTEDRAVSAAMQRLMIERTSCDPVIELATGHSPFYADPDALADALVGIAAARAPST
ncbi:MAG TPA: alpha/beta fold hydrolase [Pseudomonadales bacterium]|nr:alpha/beta fold hydrolase [Pseudomonadales bacterium]